jgi:eukaryotic-like serine/threonine-protein kinase
VQPEVLAQWPALSRLLDAALDLDPEAQRAWLDALPPEEASLRPLLERLLVGNRDRSAFIDAPLPFDEQPATSPSADPAAEFTHGQRLGPYRLLRELGHGGMGTVYLAARDDDSYKKEVAIKLVRGVGSGELLARFRRERQILARLEHPNIAHLVDAGSAQGVPYVVMEYVQGTPVDTYCESHQLTLHARLELFQIICAAVHRAHQHLIVHRDLKPSNILVTEEGVPKLLDFGIAKELAVEGEVDGTRTAARLMTPEYASPEQIRGEPVTTASDVYSLGVLLYRLLTGRSPYRSQSSAPHLLAQAVCEEDPARPSTTVPVEDGSRTPRDLRRLAGDLDRIVLKSLNKEPTRRYASADEFSKDVGRYLSGMPVLARRPTLAYLTGKFVRRNPGGIMAAALVLIAVVVGASATLWQAKVAFAERARAEKRFNDVRQMANTFLFEFHDAIENLPGSTAARALVVRKALEYFDSLAKEVSRDPSLERELALAYVRLGDIQSGLGHPNLGDTKSAMASYEKALRLQEQLLAAAPDNAALRAELAVSYRRRGDMLWRAARVSDSAAAYRHALDLEEPLLAADPTNRKLRHAVATSRELTGYALAASSGQLQPALSIAQKGLAGLEELLREDPHDRQARLDLSRAYGHVAQIYGGLTTDRRAAINNDLESLRILDPLAHEAPNDAFVQLKIMTEHSAVGDDAMLNGDFDLALEHYRLAAALMQSLLDSEPANAEYRADLALTRAHIASIRTKKGEPAEALSLLKASLDTLNDLGAKNPANAVTRVWVAQVYDAMGAAHERLALDMRAPVRVQFTHWLEARSGYDKSRVIWAAFRDSGATTGVEAAKPDSLALDIVRCDAAIQRLQSIVPQKVQE